METLSLEILTPNGVIFDGQAASITLPGEEGEFGVLPEHASLMTLLLAGVIEVEKSDKSVESVVINWGHVQIRDNRATVLVDGAVPIRGENESEIAKAIDSAKSLVNDIKDSNSIIAVVTSKIETAAQKLV